MRGRKLSAHLRLSPQSVRIKKESPNEGTEMDCNADFPVPHELKIKKESPNEGTEIVTVEHERRRTYQIKKESPNEGTEIPNASGIIRQFLFT